MTPRTCEQLSVPALVHNLKFEISYFLCKSRKPVLNKGSRLHWFSFFSFRWHDKMYVPSYTSPLTHGRMSCDNVSALLLSTQFSLKGEKVILFLWYLTSSFVSEKLFTAGTICWNSYFIECSCARVFDAQHRAALCCAQMVLHAQGRSHQVSSRSWVGLRAHTYLQVCPFVSSCWKPGTPQCVHLNLDASIHP